MLCHPAWAVGSYSSGPPAAITVGTKSTGGFFRPEWSLCKFRCVVTHFVEQHLRDCDEGEQGERPGVQRSAKRRGCLLSYSQAEPGRELTQPSPRLLAQPCTSVRCGLASSRNLAFTHNSMTCTIEWEVLHSTATKGEPQVQI